MPSYWLGIATRMSQDLVSIESIYTRKTSSFKSLTTLLPRSMRSVPFRRASLLNHLVNFHQLPTFTSPPSRTAPSNNTIPTKPASAKEPLASRRSPGSRRIGGCSDAPGPADLLAPSGPCDGAPRPGAGLWMGDSRVAPYAVARWALCCDPQLVRGQCVGGAVWAIDNSNIKTHTSGEELLG